MSGPVTWLCWQPAFPRHTMEVSASSPEEAAEEYAFHVADPESEWEGLVRVKVKADGGPSDLVRTRLVRETFIVKEVPDND